MRDSARPRLTVYLPVSDLLIERVVRTSRDDMLATTRAAVTHARSLAGDVEFAGGGLLPLAFGIVRDAAPPMKVPGGIGFIASLIGIGGAAGLLLARVIVDNVSYHWLFWVPLVVIVIAAIATYVLVPGSPIRAPARINRVAAALMSVGLTAVLLAVTRSATWRLGLVADDRAGRRGPGGDRHLDRGRGPRAAAARRHADDVRADGLADEPGGVPRGDGDVLRARRAAAVRAGAGLHRYGFGASVLQSGVYLITWTA